MSEENTLIFSVTYNKDKKIFHTKYDEANVNELSEELLNHLNSKTVPFIQMQVTNEVTKRLSANFLKRMKGEKA